VDRQGQTLYRTALRHALDDLRGGYEFERCRTRVEKQGLQDRIFLPGVQENVGVSLDKPDMVFDLTEMEGLPNVLIEAHLAGKPVVATPAGGTSEVVDYGKTGFVLASAKEPDPDEIMTSLATLLTDDAMRATFGEAARIHAEPRFAVDSVLAQTLELLKD
jgi:glycosyltransferase involved in cell wall biosynthesis